MALMPLTHTRVLSCWGLPRLSPRVLLEDVACWVSFWLLFLRCLGPNGCRISCGFPMLALTTCSSSTAGSLLLGGMIILHMPSALDAALGFHGWQATKFEDAVWGLAAHIFVFLNLTRGSTGWRYR